MSDPLAEDKNPLAEDKKYEGKEPISEAEDYGEYYLVAPGGQKSGRAQIFFNDHDEAEYRLLEDPRDTRIKIPDGYTFFHIKPEDNPPKKVGGKKSRRNKKSRKNRRKTNRRR